MLRFLARRWFLLVLLAGLWLALAGPVDARAWLGRIPMRVVGAGILFLVSFTLPTAHVTTALARPWPVLFALTMTFGLAPVLCYAVGTLLFTGDFRTGMTIVGCIPCTLSTAALWTRFAGGSEAVALLVSASSNGLVFLFTSFWLSLLTQQEVAIDGTAMAFDLLGFVVLPTGLAQAIRAIALMAAFADRRRGPLGNLCRLLVLFIIIKAAMDSRAHLSASGSAWPLVDLTEVAVICVAVHVLLLTIGYRLGLLTLSKADAIAVAYSGSQKTLPVGAVIAADYFPSAPLAIVPILFYQVGQLIAGTYAADHFFYSADHSRASRAASASGESGNPVGSPRP